jgi:hypothetical protein
MNTFDQQEARSKHAISWPVVLKVGLGLGIYLFIFSGGAPWTGAGVGSAVLGRALPWPLPLIAVVHFGLCLLYTAAISAVIYRLSIWTGVAAGVATSLAIYGLTYPLFVTLRGDDGRAFAAHVVLGLFGSALYKALSVPRARRDSGWRRL